MADISSRRIRLVTFREVVWQNGFLPLNCQIFGSVARRSWTGMFAVSFIFNGSYGGVWQGYNNCWFCSACTDAHTHTRIWCAHPYAPLHRGVITFKEFFVNVVPPGKGTTLSRGSHRATWSPNAAGRIPGCSTRLLMNIRATQQLTLSDHVFFSRLVVVLVVYGVAVMSSSGCQKGSACSCGGSPQSLSHSLFPWQSFRQHHRLPVCKDPYNLFFQQPLVWCSAPERASNYQVQRERTLQPSSLRRFTRRCIATTKKTPSSFE